MRVSDRELVVQCLGGEQNAFGLIVERYWSPIAGTMRTMLADADTAEDAAHRRPEELREPDKLAAWLGTIARNVARKHHQSRRI